MILVHFDIQMVTYAIYSVEVYKLTPEGQSIVDQGSPEYRVWQAVGTEGMSIKDLQVSPSGSNHKYRVHEFLGDRPNWVQTRQRSVS